MKQMWIGIFAAGFQIFAIILAGVHFLMLVCIGYIPGIYFYYKAKKEFNIDGGKLTKAEVIYSILLVIFAVASIVMVATGKVSI